MPSSCPCVVTFFTLTIQTVLSVFVLVELNKPLFLFATVAPLHSVKLLEYLHQCKVVAREGVAPPISGCKPDVILFHQQAIKVG